MDPRTLFWRAFLSYETSLAGDGTSPPRLTPIPSALASSRPTTSLPYQSAIASSSRGRVADRALGRAAERAPQTPPRAAEHEHPCAQLTEGPVFLGLASNSQKRSIRALLHLECCLEELNEIVAGFLARLRIGLHTYHTALPSVSGRILVFTSAVERVKEMGRPRKDMD